MLTSPENRPDIGETRLLETRSTQGKAEMEAVPNANIATPVHVFDTNQIGQNSTTSSYASLAAYMMKGAELKVTGKTKPTFARPGSFNDTAPTSTRLRDPLKELFGKNSTLPTASTSGKIPRFRPQKELSATPNITTRTPSTASSAKRSGKIADAKPSQLLGEHAHRDSIQRELIELDSDEHDSGLLTDTGRPAGKKRTTPVISSS